MKKQILPFLGVLSSDLNYVFRYYKPYLESTMDFSRASSFCIHSSSSDAAWQNGIIQVTGMTEREFYLSFLSVFSSTLCIQQKGTVRQTEPNNFFGQQSPCNMCCSHRNIFRSLRKPGFSQGEFSSSPYFHSCCTPQPQLHSSSEGKTKQLWFTIKCHRSPVRT